MSHSGFDFTTTDATASGVYLVAHDDLAPIDSAASDVGWLVRRIDLHDCADKDAVMQRVVAALDAADRYNHDWDALSHSLHDLSWLPASGYVLLFDHADSLRDAAKADFNAMLDVFDEAADVWIERNVPFWVFFAMPEAEFDALDG